MDKAPIYRELGRCRIIDLSAASAESPNLAELCDRIAWDEEASVVLLTFGNEIDNRLSSAPGSPVERDRWIKAAGHRCNPGRCHRDQVLNWRWRATSGSEPKMPGSDLPQIQEGRIPSNGGTQRLPRLVGQGKALQMILTGELNRCRRGVPYWPDQPGGCPGIADEHCDGIGPGDGREIAVVAQLCQRSALRRQGSDARSGIEDGTGSLSSAVHDL